MNKFFNALSFYYFSKTVENIPYQWASKHAKKEEATFLMANDSLQLCSWYWKASYLHSGNKEFKC